MLKNFINKIRNDEEGAVTVDWVVLTAGVVILGITLVTSLQGTLSTVVCSIGEQVSSRNENASCGGGDGGDTDGGDTDGGTTDGGTTDGGTTDT